MVEDCQSQTKYEEALNNKAFYGNIHITSFLGHNCGPNHLEIQKWPVPLLGQAVLTKMSIQDGDTLDRDKLRSL